MSGWTDGSWIQHANPAAEVVIGAGVRVPPPTEGMFDVSERLVIGDHSTIHAGAIIAGRDVEIGQEAWILPGAIIGGGSRYERQSSLKAGHYLHLGRDSFINTARPVTIGNEVGLGTRTSLFTHGAYLSAVEGFPVRFAPVAIGDRVWLPGATVNPGVTIGSDVVVAVGSVVISDIPDGSLAAGTPAKVIRKNAYPRELLYASRDAFWLEFLREYPDEITEDVSFTQTTLRAFGALFDLHSHHVEGPATEQTERMRDQLRRYGIRFYSRPVDGRYEDWA